MLTYAPMTEPILMFTCGYDGQDKRSPLMALISVRCAAANFFSGQRDVAWPSAAQLGLISPHASCQLAHQDVDDREDRHREQQPVEVDGAHHSGSTSSPTDSPLS